MNTTALIEEKPYTAAKPTSELTFRSMRRELVVVRIVACGRTQEKALDILGQWSGRLLELDSNYLTAELTDEPEKISQFLSALEPYGLFDVHRSGPLVC